MYLKSKKIALLILGVTSVACSKIMFLFFNDPEGPNLLVVMTAATVIYFLSLATYYLFNLATKNALQRFSLLSLADFKKVLMIIFVQIVITAAFYFCLN